MTNLGWKAFKKKALSKLSKGEQLGGKDGVITPLIKHLLKTALESELDFYHKTSFRFSLTNHTLVFS